jgi:hypothetical protein
VIFNFEGRRVTRPGGKRKSKTLAPALQSLLEKPFTLVLGDAEEDRATLRRALEEFMHANGDDGAIGLPLGVLTQRCALQFGQDVLHSLFQQALQGAQKLPPSPLAAVMRLIPSGVHISLMWQPFLERAIAEMQPNRTIYAIQPSLVSSGGKPRTVKRAAGATAWKMEPMIPKRFDLENDIVVLHMYGGYSPEPRPIFSQPLLTEDDHIHGFLGTDGFRPPDWMLEILAQPRSRPGWFVGLSVLDMRHRMLLHWLYDQRPAPEGSLALLQPSSDPKEPEIWNNGSGLPGTARIAVVTEDLEQLAPLLLDNAAAGGA